MAHGQPDFGMYGIAETIYRLSDMGELAARLGSIVTYDRRGDVVFLDGFENGLAPYTTAGGGTGNSVSQSSDYSRNGGYSAKMVCGSDGVLRAELVRHQAYPVHSKMGHEISFTMHANISQVRIHLAKRDGTDFKSGYVVFNEDDSTLSYYGSDGATHVFATGVKLRETVGMFHTAKLVVDFVEDRYERFILNETTYDLSGYAINVTASPTASELLAYITVIGSAGNNATIYLDDMIITQNEP